MTTICRLCLCKLENAGFNKTRNSNKSFAELSQMLHEMFKIDLTASKFSSIKDLPVNYCNPCCDKLLSSYGFYQTIQRSQEILISGKPLSDDAKIVEQNLLDPSTFPVNISEVKLETLDENEDETKPLHENNDLDSKTTKSSNHKSHIVTTETKTGKSTKLRTKSLKTNKKSIETDPKNAKHGVSKKQQHENDIKIREFYSLTCSVCSEAFESFGTYRAHMIQKHDIKRPAIVCCKKRLVRKTHLLEHITYHVNPTEYQCKDCGRQCLNKFRLEQHRLQHHTALESRKYQCDKCPKRFLVPSNLKSHMLTHLSHEEKERLKTYICDLCGNSYSSKYFIEQHIQKAHLQVYSFVCDICAKPFKSKNDFLYHKSRVHATVKEPRVQCEICSTWVANEKRLYAHFRRTHVNPGPHICNVCGKVSPTREALRSHQRYVHEAPRRFKCTYCEKAFKKEVNLKEHMTTHLGGVLYTCCFCDKTFNSGANMYSHRKKKHPEENAKLVQENRNS